MLKRLFWSFHCMHTWIKEKKISMAKKKKRLFWAKWKPYKVLYEDKEKDGKERGMWDTINNILNGLKI
jgi:hypothetical protein